MRGKQKLSLDRLCAVCLQKICLGPSDAAQTQGSQQLKGCKVYSLCIFLFLFYHLTRTAILLCHLLSDLSF